MFSCYKFGKWICLQMDELNIKGREIAVAAGVTGSAVDNYRVGACYPRMPKLMGIVLLIAKRRETNWEEIWLEIGRNVILDHHPNKKTAEVYSSTV